MEISVAKGRWLCPHTGQLPRSLGAFLLLSDPTARSLGGAKTGQAGCANCGFTRRARCDPQLRNHRSDRLTAEGLVLDQRKRALANEQPADWRRSVYDTLKGRMQIVGWPQNALLRN